MPEFIATFTTGFGEYIQKQIAKDMAGIKVVGLYDGLIHFKYNGDYSKLIKLIYLNNIFYVLKTFRGKNISFEQMTNVVCKKRNLYLSQKGLFVLGFLEKINSQKLIKA